MSQTLITRANIDQLLDAGMIEMRSARNGKWYSIRRNGKTKTWKRDASRISIPCKVGFRECFTIDEGSFCYNVKTNSRYDWYSINNALDPNDYRVRET